MSPRRGRTLSDVRVAVTGSHGLIGTALVERSRADGHEPVAVVRATPTSGEIGWDPQAGRLDPQALDGIDAVVNLAGAGIGDNRWTDEYKRGAAGAGRVGTTLLADVDGRRAERAAACCSPARPSGTTAIAATRCSTSARRRAPASSPTSPGVGGEHGGGRARPGARVVHLRTGIVLAPTGGALRKMLPLFKLGLGGRFGYGKQWMSWIGLDDEVGAIVHLLTSDGAARSTSPRRTRCATPSWPTPSVRRCTARPSCRSRRSDRSWCSAASSPRRCCSRASGCCRGAPRRRLRVPPPDHRGGPGRRARPLTAELSCRFRPDRPGSDRTATMGSRLERGLDVELDLDLVADQDPAGLQRGVVLQAEVLAVDRAGQREPRRCRPTGRCSTPPNSRSNVTGLVTPRIVRSPCSS